MNLWMNLGFVTLLLVTCGAQQNGDVRIVGGLGHWEGRVEIYLFNQWGTIRYDASGYQQEGTAQAICRQLGFYDVAHYGSVTDLSFNFPKANDSESAWLHHVHCPYKKNPVNAVPHILRCHYEYDGTSDHTYDMGIRCVLSDIMEVKPYDTQVRLVGGSNSHGFLEVFVREWWGLVCNIQQYDADSACRQLGYTNAVGYSELNFHDYILADGLNDFHCTESSPCLRSCFSYPNEDVHIQCKNHSLITCTFNTSLENESYGTPSLCSNSPIAVGLIVGITAAVVVGLLLLLVVICIPCCIFITVHRRRYSYQTINA